MKNQKIIKICEEKFIYLCLEELNKRHYED